MAPSLLDNWSVFLGCFGFRQFIQQNQAQTTHHWAIIKAWDWIRLGFEAFPESRRQEANPWQWGWDFGAQNQPEVTLEPSDVKEFPPSPLAPCCFSQETSTAAYPAQSWRVFSHLYVWRILIIQHFSIQFLCSGRQPPSQQVSQCCLQDTCQLFWLPVPSAS